MKTVSGFLVCLALISNPLFAKGQQTLPEFQPPQVISTVEPSYPANAVAGGTVVLEVRISPNGQIQDVRVLQQARGFTQQALNAVRKWKFKPATLTGRAVAASIPVAFSFSQPIVWWNRQTK